MSSDNTIKPKNFGSKWTESERDVLLKSISNKNDMDENITKISIILERSEGGVRGELKKMIIFRYLMGDDVETISDDMNIPITYIKMIIKNYLEKDAETDIVILKRENELLKLRLENAKLQNSLKNEVGK